MRKSRFLGGAVFSGSGQLIGQMEIAEVGKAPGTLQLPSVFGGALHQLMQCVVIRRNCLGDAAVRYRAVICHALHETMPSWAAVGAVGVAALLASVVCLGALYTWRDGDADVRSVWICSRNDVFANFAVLLAALGVFGAGTRWSDIMVAAFMAGLPLQGAVIVKRQSLGEIHATSPTAAFPCPWQMLAPMPALRRRTLYSCHSRP